MSSPTLGDFQTVKKLARFTVGIKAVQFRYEWQTQDEAAELRVLVDSDWAGCVRSRWSTESPFRPELHMDSSVAKSFVSRRGPGRIRHVEVKELWLQDVVKLGTIKLRKVHNEAVAPRGRQVGHHQVAKLGRTQQT